MMRTTERWRWREGYKKPCREIEKGGGNGEEAAEREKERRDEEEEGHNRKEEGVGSN